jgi:SAM-dependent methyltransferase
MFSRFLAGQLSRPSRVIGPLVLAPLWNRRNQALNDQALRLLALRMDDTDASAAMTDYCLGRFRREVQEGRLGLTCASAGSIPYPADHFGKVFSVNSLFYWPDVAHGIRECWRVTRAGGTLVLVFTSSRSLEGRSFAAWPMCSTGT